MEGLKEVEGIETAIGYAKEIDPAKVADYDALVIGAPNHMARPSRTMRKFVDRLAEIDLKLRGPGEVYGVRQSGIPDLKIATLTNGVLVVRVRRAAETMIDKVEKYPVLKSMLVKLRNKMEKA